MAVGVLALQGAFAEHEAVLDRLGEEWFEIRSPEGLRKGMDGIILPGGESTVQGKLLRDLGMMDELRAMIRGGLPVLATCAGMILLAERIEGDGAVHLGTMPVTVRRNAYGRQLGSFDARGSFGGIGDVEMRFIRAPFLTELRDGAEALSVVDGNVVAARFGNQVATAFHPELTDDDRVHRYFLDILD
ncbi:MAG: pyridoxal 5'-phosphate synthase glutaminase subunit PdxT [Candidatus Methanomethylophilaceae archaeon]|nr:pyridoxal 5'-phosphate synthase glutaminase subunit PdxT [Candidatus Methanomethylophilaceae archaeon]